MIDRETIAARIYHFRWFAAMQAKRGLDGYAKFYRMRCRQEIARYREFAQ